MAENDWKIAKSAANCCICAATFDTGQFYFSALLQEGSELLRKDYCAGCFQRNRPEHVFYFWKAANVSPEDEANRKPRRPVVDVEYVFEFFKRLDGDSTPQRVAFRYILALMLTRQKLLIQEGTRKEGEAALHSVGVQVFREKRGGQSHVVIEPSLSEEEIAGVSAELGVLLGLSPAVPIASGK